MKLELPVWLNDLKTINFQDLEVKNTFNQNNKIKYASVLMLFSGNLDSSELDNNSKILFTKRSANLKNHPNQISFPGGKMDVQDNSLKESVLREFEEEIGVDKNKVEIFNSLAELFIPYSNFLVKPFLGFTEVSEEKYEISKDEIRSFRNIKILDLINPENRYRLVFKEKSNIRSPYDPIFKVDDYIVWGFTAKVLDIVLEKAMWSVPWDYSKTIQIDELLK